MEEKRVRRKKEDGSFVVTGKVPPQAIGMEKAILGACMLERTAFFTVVNILKPETFYVPKHQILFRVFISLDQKSTPIDLFTVAEELRDKGVLEEFGGLGELTILLQGVTSAANIEAHARTVFKRWVQREMIKVGSELLQDCYEDELQVADFLDLIQTKLFSISQGLYKKDFGTMQEDTMLSLKQIGVKANRVEGELTGVPSGFRDIDNNTGGFQNTDLIVLAARPSVGKTALALNIAKNAATHPVQPVGVAFFSLEMSTEQLVNRLLSAESEIVLEKIRDGRLSEFEQKCLYNSGAKIAEIPLYIDDTASINILELKAKIKRLIERLTKEARKRKVPLKKLLGLIIIDYLQLMEGINDGSNRSKNDTVSEISRQLKIFAKELEIPIIALSQMSRAIESRAGGEPYLSDLRESGAIEQDADIVMFLWKEGYETKLKTAKHRNGSLNKIHLNAHLEFQKFTDGGAEPFKPKNLPTGNNSSNFDEGVQEAENELSFIKSKK
jgi:replicative DNA helicase